MSLMPIYSAGDDGLLNQFQIVIPPFPGVLDLGNTNLRVLTAAIPEQSIGEYTVEYKTQSFPKPSGKITTPKEWSFTFRVDKYWKVYQGLSNWLNIKGNNITGGMSPDVINGISPTRIDISVYTIDANDIPTSSGWVMVQSYIKTLTGVDFDYGSGDPIIATATLGYLYPIVLA